MGSNIFGESLSGDRSNDQLAQAQQAWAAMTPKLRGLFTPSEIHTWISHINVIAANKDEVVLAGANAYAANRIRNEFLARLQSRWALVDNRRLAVATDSGRNFGKNGAPLNNRANVIAAAVSGAPEINKAGGAPTDKVAGAPQATGQPTGQPTCQTSSASNSLTQSGRRFENYVVGPSNELAFVLAKKIADRQIKGEIALFHGPHGVGKTHLLEAISARLAENNVPVKTISIGAMEFLSQFLAALRDASARALTQAILSADMVLIDDVHLICGKKATEEELENIIRRLIARGASVVLCADVGAAGLPTFSPRLKNLLQSGFDAPIILPDFPVRRAIAESKAQALAVADASFVLPDDALDIIAARVSASGRVIEGVVKQIFSRSILMGKEVDMAAVLETLSGKSVANLKGLTIERIKKAVAGHFEMAVDDLCGKSRKREFVRPRQIAMYLCRNHTDRSLASIGARFGGRDHATVIHAVGQIEDFCLRDSKMAADIEAIIARLSMVEKATGF